MGRFPQAVQMLISEISGRRILFSLLHGVYDWAALLIAVAEK